MSVRSLPLLFLAVGGCDLIDGVKDAVEGLVDPTVAIGLVAVADAPETGIDLSKTELSSGLTATVFLADATSAADIENAPLSGLDVALLDCTKADIALPEAEDGGFYVLNPEDGPDGCDQAEVELNVAAAESVGDGVSMPLTIPDSFDPALPEVWTAGEDLAVDLSDLSPNTALVFVVDASTGSITWSNMPEGAADYYKVFASNETLTEVVIPGKAFVENTAHIVAITAAYRTPNADTVGINTVLSGVQAGRTVFDAVSTLDPKDLLTK